MIAVSSREVSRVEVRGSDHHDPKSPGGRTFNSQFITAGRGRPHAFLVEEHGVTRPHFHRVDQFQVVVAGDGHIGKRPVEPIALHYTDWYTPYGPITPAGDSLWYFTLRANENPGMYPMPGSREEKEQPTGRSLTLPTDLAPSADGAPTPVDEPRIAPVFEPHDDGLAAYTARIPAGGTLAAPAPAGGGAGQYQLVVNGSLLDGDRELPQLSLVWVAPGEPPCELRAGTAGAEVLVMQFPPPRPAA